MNKTQQAILDVLHQGLIYGYAFTSKEITEHTDFSRSTIERNLKKLVEAGKVKTIRKKHPPYGKVGLPRWITEYVHADRYQEHMENEKFEEEMYQECVQEAEEFCKKHNLTESQRLTYVIAEMCGSSHKEALAKARQEGS